MEELRTIISITALLISFWSAYVVRKLWYQTHRPVISAFVQKFDDGVGYILFNLVIFNSGNRPATDITFKINEKDIEKITVEKTTERSKNKIKSIFQAKIQLLLPDKKATTMFYGYSNTPDELEGTILKFGSQMPISINSDIVNDPPKPPIFWTVQFNVDLPRPQ